MRLERTMELEKIVKVGGMRHFNEKIIHIVVHK